VHDENPHILWSLGKVICECVHIAPDHIEICLWADGMPVEREVFTTPEAASTFAIAMLSVIKGRHD
jgi:hypothetical protein